MAMVKTSMNITEKSLATLKELSTESGVSMAEVVRRSVEVQKFLRSVSSEGGKILIKHKNESMTELKLL